MNFNKALLNLENDNSFYKATERIREYKINHPDNKVVSLGIGDVSLPICDYVAKKMIEAVKKETSDEFVGYGNYYGIKELRYAIQKNDYPAFSADEIYVGQGTKTDCGDILELFDKDILVGIPTPTYPIYENCCISLNKKYELIPSDENLNPIVPNKHFDVIYMCSPNNPTGVTYSKEVLTKWVEYAKNEGAVIIFDNVYHKFINKGIKSIYEVEGARECAIELRSFSKHVSFTGIRCSYYIIPNELFKDVNKLWKLRTINRFNGASYISQIGALASYDDKAIGDINKNIATYKANALYLREEFIKLGYEVIGGENAPYLWIKCKNGLKSWEVFDLFLNKLEIIVVPGIIFGEVGDDYFRVSALGRKEDIKTALDRIETYEKNK